MKNIALIILLVGLCTLFSGSVHSRGSNRAGRAIMKSWSDDEYADPLLLDAGVRERYASAQVDTFCLVWYDFEVMNWQGWTSKDNTAQEDTFSHVDDFSGVTPGPGAACFLSRARSRCGAVPVTGLTRSSRRIHAQVISSTFVRGLQPPVTATPGAKCSRPRTSKSRVL
jgi:hypothetical protein